MISKIQALLNKTVENGATQAEAELAVAKAAELMLKYGIDRRMVENRETLKNEKITHIEFNPPSSLSWQKRLATSVAKVSFCECLTFTSGKIVFVGIKEEVDSARELFTWISLQIVGFSSSAFSANRRLNLFDYQWGMVYAVTSRLDDKFNEAMSKNEYALVSLEEKFSSYKEEVFGIKAKTQEDKNLELLKRAFNSNITLPKKRGRPRKTHYSSSLLAGYKDGNKVKIEVEKELLVGKALK